MSSDLDVLDGLSLAVNLPDLVITNVVAPAVVKQGDYLDVSWTIENQGSDKFKIDRIESMRGASWGGLPTDFYFSADTIVDESDVYLGEDLYGSDYFGEDIFDKYFLAGATVGQSTTLTQLAWNQNIAGEGYLLATVDEERYSETEGRYLETNEDNNVQAIPLTIVPSNYDLIFETVTVWFDATNNSWSTSYVIANQGTDTLRIEHGLWTSSLRFNIYWSADSIYDSSDVEVYNAWWALTGNITGGRSFLLEAGAKVAVENTLDNLDVNIPLGTGYLLFIIDNDNNYLETNETNNIYAVPLPITTTEPIYTLPVELPVGWNPSQYGASNPDLIQAYGYNLEAFTQHYLDTGFWQSRPLDTFDEIAYLLANVDLIPYYGYNLEGATEHYIRYGFYEGRSTGYDSWGERIVDFDPRQYLASNPDLIVYYGYNLEGATEHYLRYGFLEGRSTNSFDPVQYLTANPDLIVYYGYDLEAVTQHYIEYGFYEGRTIYDDFDPAQYLASYDDLIEYEYHRYEYLENLTEHYIEYGFSQGRSRDLFAEDIYLASYGDLIEAFGYDLDSATEHYITYGMSEGRAKALFDPVAYLNKYEDLQLAFGDDLTAATWHYITSGYAEGRTWI